MDDHLHVVSSVERPDTVEAWREEGVRDPDGRRRAPSRVSMATRSPSVDVGKLAVVGGGGSPEAA